MRRVEARLELVGRGMSADPDKIQALQEESDKKARANAPKRKRSFKKILHEKVSQNQ